MKHHQRSRLLILFQTNRGMTLVQVLVLMGIIGIFSMSLTSLMQTQNRTQYEMNLKSSALAIRQNLTGTIGNYGAWTQTRSKNFFMKCTSPTQTYCNPGTPTTRAAIKLYNSMGQLILDSTSPTSGFTSYGEPCNTYSATGNDGCPLKVTVTWRANCLASSCSVSNFSAEEMVSINFTYSPKSKEKKIPFNPMNFNLVEQSLMKVQNNDAPVMNCSAKGKVFIGMGKSFNARTADPQGCVDYAAFVGPKGDRGPMGPMGPMGPPGPAGASATCP